MNHAQHSPYLYLPCATPLKVREAIVHLIQPKDYPCVPAISSLQNEEYLVGIYSEFGTGKNACALYQDLIYFSQTQKKSQAAYFSFWAVFQDAPPASEDEFEKTLWRELSALSSCEDPSVPWDSNFSSDPAKPNFCLSLGGDAFFVVGLHEKSSRKSRQFPWPAMIFNLYSQFDELNRLGRYEAVVKTNRAREIKIHGSLNPMVEKYNDTWEAIQFSGKENPPEWKCPFQRNHK